MKQLKVAIKNFEELMKNVEVPPCFDSKLEYLFWLEGEKEAPTQPPRFICRDCDVSYQRRMIKQGRCFNKEIDLRKITK
jgi:hypothetical protein